MWIRFDLEDMAIRILENFEGRVKAVDI